MFVNVKLIFIILKMEGDIGFYDLKEKVLLNL